MIARRFSDNRHRHSFALFSSLTMSFLFWTGSPLARADGVYISERAYLKPPAIPAQRAMLVFRNNTEKLVIESDLDGPGQRFGWIIPLPARPTRIEKTSPGLLHTLSLTLQPKIIHSPDRELPL